jgi:hypothetical protein
MTQWFFSRGSRACRHVSPRCVDHTLGGSAANRCFTNLAQQMGTARIYPQVRVTQWYEQFTRVAFGAPPGNKPKNPSQYNTWLGADTITKSPHQSTNHQPSRWQQSPRVTRNPQSQSPPNATKYATSNAHTRVSPKSSHEWAPSLKKERRGRRCSWSSQDQHLGLDLSLDWSTNAWEWERRRGELVLLLGFSRCKNGKEFC